MIGDAGSSQEEGTEVNGGYFLENPVVGHTGTVGVVGYGVVST